MYQIIRRRELNSSVTEMEILAPLVAKKAKPGQFIILRVNDEGERIPLTIAGADPAEGTVKIIFQIVGATTIQLNQKQEGEFIQDFTGPLGKPTEIEGKKKKIFTSMVRFWVIQKNISNLNMMKLSILQRFVISLICQSVIILPV